MSNRASLPLYQRVSCCSLPSGDVDIQAPDASVDIPSADIHTPNIGISGDVDLPSAELQTDIGADIG